MPSFTDEHAEALLQIQTRQIPLPGGGTRTLASTLLVWRALDYLVDRGHATTERIVELSEVDGWDPPNAPYEMRFTTTIAYWTQRLDAEHGDYDDYCCGKL